MRKVKRITKKLLKEINGMEVTWIGQDGLIVPAIVLADWDKGISIKHAVSPKELHKLMVKAWGQRNAYPIYEIKEPSFCLQTWDSETFIITGAENIRLRRFIESILNEKKTPPIKPLSGVEALFNTDPTCPFA